MKKLKSVKISYLNSIFEEKVFKIFLYDGEAFFISKTRFKVVRNKLESNVIVKSYKGRAIDYIYRFYHLKSGKFLGLETKPRTTVENAIKLFRARFGNSIVGIRRKNKLFNFLEKKNYKEINNLKSYFTRQEILQSKKDYTMDNKEHIAGYKAYITQARAYRRVRRRAKVKAKLETEVLAPAREEYKKQSVLRKNPVHSKTTGKIIFYRETFNITLLAKLALNTVKKKGIAKNKFLEKLIRQEDLEPKYFERRFDKMDQKICLSFDEPTLIKLELLLDCNDVSKNKLVTSMLEKSIENDINLVDLKKELLKLNNNNSN